MKTFFQGKAKEYAKYRPEFPPSLFSLLERKLNLTKDHKKERLLDLGCGTGKLTIPLTTYFNEVIGVDPSSDMLNVARALVGESSNITWLESYAEALPKTLGKFDIITIANAFHWMDFEIMVPWVLNHLNDEGAFVLVAARHSFWNGDLPWQKALFEVIGQWFGEEKEKIAGHLQKNKSSWEERLKDYPFSSVSIDSVHETRIWTAEEVIGFLFSMSFMNRERLANHVDEFEEAIKSTLLKTHPDNRFEEPHDISIIVAKK